jgi:UDP-glucose 4,6-dehydratase
MQLEGKVILVTGGCGFIGSAFLNHMLVKYAGTDTKFVNLDRLDYCAREKNVPKYDNYTFIKGDICDSYLVLKILNQYRCTHVLHFAAYSHVDNSFDNSVEFTINNVVGTHKLLEACRIWGRIEKFIHVSTDEVYGEIAEGTNMETAILKPTNPYAATKAAAEMLVLSYQKSFGMPIVITRGNNVYGERQYPEKVIPKFIMCVLNGEPCPIQGSGNNLRNFIHCRDVARAFEIILLHGVVEEVYNIGSTDEYSVIEIATLLCKEMQVEGVLKNVEDRKFNDVRYSVDITKLSGLGWKQEITFMDGLRETIVWYRNNKDYFA